MADGTRSQQPGAALSDELVSSIEVEERKRKLKKSRGGHLAAFTAKRREIDGLLKSPANFELVKSEREKLEQSFINLVQAHDEYHSMLREADEIERSDDYLTDARETCELFFQKVNTWLDAVESRFNGSEVRPEDSVSQGKQSVVPRNPNPPASRVSRQSSINSAKAREAIRLAELKAEVNILKQRHSLREEEF